METIARGAFRKALGSSGNIPLLWQHERRDMLATTGAGTLSLKEDGRGLAFEADLPDNPLGEYVRSMVERGDVRGMSFGMQSLPGALDRHATQRHLPSARSTRCTDCSTRR